MKNSHDPLSKDFESHLTFLFNNIHATTKISFSLFDKEFHLLSSLSNWENYVSNFFFLNCPFTPEDLAGSKAHAPFYFSDVLHLNWFIFPLTTSESFLVFGPVFETEVTPVFFRKIGFPKYVCFLSDPFFKNAERYSRCPLYAVSTICSHGVLWTL
uniref:hypothetical protein n=1 Tax=Mediterraneibacter glycyrrhizinilyticus TaxID=342942 RepID=UPI0013DDB60C